MQIGGKHLTEWFLVFRLMDFVDNNANQKDLTIEIGIFINKGSRSYIRLMLYWDRGR